MSEQTEEMASSSKAVVMSSSVIQRDKWLNLCVDVNSFVRTCFCKLPAKSEADRVQQQHQNLARKSGDIGQLRINQMGSTDYPSPSATEKPSAQNSMKFVEQIYLEGYFRVRKIFSTRNAIPHEADFGDPSIKCTPIPKGLDFLSSVSKLN